MKIITVLLIGSIIQSTTIDAQHEVTFVVHVPAKPIGLISPELLMAGTRAMKITGCNLQAQWNSE